jgi:quercetin dioxygenase-like cupin family protein
MRVEERRYNMKRISIFFITLLLLVLGLSVHVGSQMPYHGDGHIMVNAYDLKWGPIASMAPGAKIAVIEGDLSEEVPFTFRLKLPADYQIAPHTHPAYERVTVLSGTFHFAHGKDFDRDKTMALEAGGIAIMPPGEPMFGHTDEETVVQLHGTGPWNIEYINPEDDPRR